MFPDELPPFTEVVLWPSQLEVIDIDAQDEFPLFRVKARGPGLDRLKACRGETLVAVLFPKTLRCLGGRRVHD